MLDENPILLEKLQLINFRSWKHIVLGPLGSKTILVGENGVGKTNIVESLYLLSALHSYRTNETAALIRFGENSSFIQTDIIIRNRSYCISAKIAENGALSATINGRAVKPLKTLTNYLPIVLFAPEDLKLVKGEPQNRRKYIDNLFVQPSAQALISEYQKIIKHKSVLLKNPSLKNDDNLLVSLDIWNNKLIECAQKLIMHRIGKISEINPIISEIYQSLAPHSAEAFFEYEPYKNCKNVDTVEQKLLEDKARFYDQELQRGTCLYGPHRDDISLKIGINNARSGASHGESWSLALALRVCEFKLFQSQGKVPLVILDDVFAELDAKRRTKLVSIVQQLPQILVTAAVAEDIPDGLKADIINIGADTQSEPISSYVIQDVES